MKRNYIALVLVLLFIFFLILSCSTMHHYIKANRDLTTKIVKSLYRNNENAFYLSSTYANFSIVWTYNKEKVEIYRLQNGDIKQKQLFETKENIKFIAVSPEAIDNELDQRCAPELDGDFLGVYIKTGDKTINEEYAVNINCLKSGNYESELLRRIAKDICYYKMWEFKY